jgi:diguanylate cyclase (GGDEF)-like protein
MWAWKPLRRYWTDLLTGGADQCPAGDPCLRRIKLLNLMLLVGAAFIFFFAVLDIFVTGRALDAAAELAGGTGLLATFIYLRATGNIETAAVASALITLVLVLGDTMVAGTRDMAFFWIALFPLVAFFLLGAQRGLLLTGVFYAAAMVTLYYGMDHWMPVTLNWIAMLNIGGTLLGIVVFVYYYEWSYARAQRGLEEAAQKDFLTGLYNRRHFIAQFEMEHERAVRHGLPLSLLLIDIDYLKLVNDNHGHEVGDSVIQSVARQLIDGLRRNDLVARLGGEEFGVLLPHTSALQAARVAEKLRMAVEESVIFSDGKWISVTISIGLAENGPSRASFTSLFAAADGALYHAKQAGRNRVMPN